MIGQIILLGVLILLSAFFSLIETAFMSVSSLRMMHLVEQQKKNADIVKKLKDDTPTLLSTILIGNNLVNVGSSALATVITLELFQQYNLPFQNPIAITTGIMTFMLLVFGEITPKTLATQHAEKIVLSLAKLMRFTVVLFWPLTFVLNKITSYITKIFGATTRRPLVTVDELKTMISIGEQEGEIKDIEKKMIHNLFNLDKTSVNKIMVPRHDMFALDANKKLHEVLESILLYNYSRVPVYETTKDKIIGILYIKDILNHLKNNKLDVRVADMMKEPFFVPETKKIDTLLHQFRKRKQHMAIVIDEHGLVIGSVTIEDILEEIVGEIKDETDIDEQLIKKIKHHEWIVEGRAEIKELNKELKLGLKETPDFDTLAGYVMFKLGRIPREKEQLKVGGVLYIVEEKQSQRIKSVRIIKLKDKK
ncbi:HlyC/CorC family transporter [Candidatus Woesearchaeota archaeon]|nr:HlyC/CorC family transporter [Candidatus Woesearchaeota archaeon]